MVGFRLDDGSFPNPLKNGCFSRIHQPIKMVVGRPSGTFFNELFIQTLGTASPQMAKKGKKNKFKQILVVPRFNSYRTSV